MRKKWNYYALASISVLFLSCGTTSEEGTDTNIEDTATEVPSPECDYNMIDQDVRVYWTAFKHTDKIAVKGKMDSAIFIEGNIGGSSPMQVFSLTPVWIWTSSINSKDPVRDKKLKEIYFGSMKNTDIIKGNLISWDGSDSEGTCNLMLTMNGNEREVSGNYTVQENVVQIRFTIEPNQWDAEDAIAKLGEACAEKHTGEDGKTVFWPDVEILVEATFEKDCPDGI